MQGTTDAYKACAKGYSQNKWKESYPRSAIAGKCSVRFFSGVPVAEFGLWNRPGDQGCNYFSGLQFSCPDCGVNVGTGFPKRN